jgi:hypothetical protein
VIEIYNQNLKTRPNLKFDKGHGRKIYEKSKVQAIPRSSAYSLRPFISLKARARKYSQPIE